MTDKNKLLKLRKLADAMYYAAANLGPTIGCGENLRKTMEEYHKFIIHEYHKEEPVSEDLEEEAEKYLEEHIEGGSATERSGFKTWGKYIARHFAEWQKEQMMIDAIICEVEWYDGLYLNFTQETLDEVLSNKGIEAGNKVKVMILKV